MKKLLVLLCIALFASIASASVISITAVVISTGQEPGGGSGGNTPPGENPQQPDTVLVVSLSMIDSDNANKYLFGVETYYKGNLQDVSSLRMNFSDTYGTVVKEVDLTAFQKLSTGRYTLQIDRDDVLMANTITIEARYINLVGNTSMVNFQNRPVAMISKISITKNIDEGDPFGFSFDITNNTALSKRVLVSCWIDNDFETIYYCNSRDVFVLPNITVPFNDKIMDKNFTQGKYTFHLLVGSTTENKKLYSSDFVVNRKGGADISFQLGSITGMATSEVNIQNIMVPIWAIAAVGFVGYLAFFKGKVRRIVTGG